MNKDKFQNFYVRSSLFVGLSIAGAGINYALYPLLSRILDLQAFGDFVTVIGLSSQVMGVLLAFSVISIGLVRRYGEAEAHRNAQVIQRMLLWLFLGVSLLVFFLSPYMLDALKIEYDGAFVVLSAILILAVPSNIWSGYLQAHKEQIRVGISGVCVAILKFVAAVLMATLAGISGGLWGYVIGSLLGLVVLYYLPGKKVPTLAKAFRRPSASERAFLREYGWHILQAVLVVTALVFLQNYDLIRAKILFGPTVAGVYGGVSVLSNALYYVAFLLIWVILPEFSRDDLNSNRRVLFMAYRLLGGLCIAIVLGGVLLGDEILGLLLGEAFSEQGKTLVVASLYQITLVSVTLYAFYLLVLQKQRSLLLAALVFLCCMVIPLRFTNSPMAMILSLLFSLVFAAVAYSIISWVLDRQKNR